jgi:hypothetical protein
MQDIGVCACEALGLTGDLSQRYVCFDGCRGIGLPGLRMFLWGGLFTCHFYFYF